MTRCRRSGAEIDVLGETRLSRGLEKLYLAKSKTGRMIDTNVRGCSTSRARGAGMVVRGRGQW